MILEEDSLLHFRYDTITQILSISWPDLSNTPLPEIEDTFQKLARNIRNYDIRLMLADHRSGFSMLGDENYKKVVEDYHRLLGQTNLEKIARLIPDEPAWEYLITNYSKKLKKKLHLNFKVRFFTKKAEALAWLQKG